MKMMKYIRFLFVFASVLVVTNSCDQDQIYTDELYKNVIAIICSDDFNILEDTQMLGEEATGYVSVSCGGTHPVAKDVRISFFVDMGVLEDYNWSVYDADRSRYANLLPPSKYDMEQMHVIIPKGTYAGWMPIRFIPEGLSPDSIYFLPLSISSTSAYELNPEKTNVLYRVLIKNQYAEQFAFGYTNYRMMGFIGEDPVSIPLKPMHPLNANKVRIMVGDLEFTGELADIEAGAIVIEVTDGKNVKITPFKENGTLSVTQVDVNVDYPNTFEIERDWDKRFKVFKLNYRYRIGNTTEVEVQEELRLEFTE